MIRVERATPADFESVLPLLESFNNPAITREHWRRLFHLPWPSDDDSRGFLLRDGERAVGFFGAIPSERRIDGRVEKFANLTSWVTLPEYRQHSIKLCQAVATIEGRTLTCMTPLTATHPFYRRFGFHDLETKLRVLLPVPWPPQPRAWMRYRITSDLHAIRARLSGEELSVFEDHAAEPCRHLLIHGGGERCHVVFSRSKGRRRYLARVHHLSDRRIFLENLDRIRLHLTLAARGAGVMLESRWLDGVTPAWSREVGIGQVPVFKSATLRAEQIDNLYSELVLLPL